MPKALELGQFSMVPKFSTTCFNSSLANSLEQTNEQTLLQLFHPHFQMHVHQNNVMAHICILYVFSIRTLFNFPPNHANKALQNAL